MPKCGYSHGFIWTKEAMDDLWDLIVSGHTMMQSSQILSKKYNYEISYGAIHSTLQRKGLNANTMVNKNEAKVYQNLTIPMDNYMISCDHHAPYYSAEWMNRLLMVAEKHKIRKHIIAGDLYDFNFISLFPAEEPKDLDQEAKESEQSYKIVDYFDKVYLIQGNHERRIGNQTEGRIRSRHILSVFGLEKYMAKIVYSLYDRIQIEDKYVVVHPKSYSQISTAVSKRMAEKFHAHILNAHGHFVGLTYDRSGRYMCVDLGGCFDTTKIEYCSMRTTTHPVWNNGFGMIKNGKFTLFHRETDWGQWL